jgi:hypothetical protein
VRSSSTVYFHSWALAGDCHLKFLEFSGGRTALPIKSVDDLRVWVVTEPFDGALEPTMQMRGGCPAEQFTGRRQVCSPAYFHRPIGPCTELWGDVAADEQSKLLN